MENEKNGENLTVFLWDDHRIKSDDAELISPRLALEEIVDLGEDYMG